MLVLTRKLNESIVIGDSIEITVVAVEGDHVKLGIKAPRQISIHRREVYDQIKKANEEAARTSPVDLSAVQKLLPPLKK